MKQDTKELLKSLAPPSLLLAVLAIVGICVFIFHVEPEKQPFWYDRDKMIVEYENKFYKLKPLELIEEE